MATVGVKGLTEFV